MGGAGAIGALAFGVEEIGLDPVQVITGPGNIYVAAAKRVVRGQAGIDSEAGTTEILVIADDTADATLVAADLVSQAEHDEAAAAVLATDSPELADRVARELERLARATRHSERVADCIVRSAVGDRAGRRSRGRRGLQQRVRAGAPRDPDGRPGGGPGRYRERRSDLPRSALAGEPRRLPRRLEPRAARPADRRDSRRDSERTRSSGRSRSSATTVTPSARSPSGSSHCPAPKIFRPTVRPSPPASRRL